MSDRRWPVPGAILAALVGAGSHRLIADGGLAGAAFETFVATEQTLPLGDRVFALPLSGLWRS